MKTVFAATQLRSLSNMSEALFDEFRQLSTPVISDALDALGLKGALKGIKPIAATGDGLVVGSAYTVQFQPVPDGATAPAADYIDDVPAGSIIVLMNGGRTDCTVWGGVLAHQAKRLRLRGTVIDGCCRDIEAIRSAAYPVFARGLAIQSGKNRARMVARQVLGEIDGIKIHPGDLVCGDENGVLVLPRSRAEEILEWAKRVQEAENQIIQYLEAGGTLEDARRKFNYNRFALRPPRAK